MIIFTLKIHSHNYLSILCVLWTGRIIIRKRRGLGVNCSKTQFTHAMDRGFITTKPRGSLERKLGRRGTGWSQPLDLKSMPRIRFSATQNGMRYEPLDRDPMAQILWKPKPSTTTRFAIYGPNQIWPNQMPSTIPAVREQTDGDGTILLPSAARRNGAPAPVAAPWPRTTIWRPKVLLLVI
jgi:hypothetical protein